MTTSVVAAKTGFPDDVDLTAPGPIGGTTPAAISATSLTASGLFKLTGVENAITAFATGGQGSATALSATKNFHRISVCATAADSVKLPAATAGQIHYIRNDGAAAAQIFGTSPDTINGVATGTGVSLGAGMGAFFVCSVDAAWTSTPLTTSSIAPLVIEDANTVAQRNGTTAQAFRVFNTYTDASNYERGFVRYASNVLEIGHEAAGTGSAGREVKLTVGTLGAIKAGTAANPADMFYIGPATFSLSSALRITWASSSTNAGAGADTGITRLSAGVLGIGNGNASSVAGDLKLHDLFSVPTGALGQSLGLQSLTELTTIADAATTDTTIQMPAGAIVIGVSCRVTTAITCTTNFNIGDSGNATRFGTNISKAANTTNAGAVAPYVNASALSVRITPDTVPSDATGRLRVTIHYILITPPTS